jgi:GNAT superfamily N-acetyltransferase
LCGVDGIEIKPLPKGYRRQAAELFYEAFRAKFEPLLGSQEHGVAILERDLEPGLVIAALAEGRLVGVAGLEYAGGYFFDPKWRSFAREFGWLRGLLRLVLFLPFARHRGEGDLTLGALAVAASMRGQGVGTQLMEAVFDWACEKGFRSVRLEVVDTNPLARRLYERLGFVALRTQRLPFFFNRLGFSAVTLMVKEMNENANV